jgi:hypothetical protein
MPKLPKFPKLPKREIATAYSLAMTIKNETN